MPHPRRRVSSRASRSGRWKKGRFRRALRRRGLLPPPRTLRALRRLAERLPTSGNDLEIFHDGDLLYERMLEDIAGAGTRILMEMYMFLGDRTGRRFAEALARKAREGIPVRIIYDAIGCITTPSRLFDGLREAGAELLAYHPVAPWRRNFALFGRDHRKILVVDGRIGYTGGANIGDPWAGRARGGLGWRDTHARVEGPAAGDLEVLIADTWCRESGRLLDIPRVLPREEGKAARAHARAPRRQIYVIGGHGLARRAIRRIYLTALGHTRRRITITSSYFIPDRKVRRALRMCMRRGIDVRVLLPERSDIRIADLASRALFDRLLGWGLCLYLWRPTVLHAKIAVIDGLWSTIGSANLDCLSLHHNLEANLVIVDEETGTALEETFARDLASSQPLTLEEWRTRPFLGRLWERLAYSLRRWL